jgi:hypothetical protein
VRLLEARLGKAFHASSLSRVLKRLDLSHQKIRPVHLEADPKAQERFRKGALRQPEGDRRGPSGQAGRLGADDAWRRLPLAGSYRRVGDRRGS